MKKETIEFFTQTFLFSGIDEHTVSNILSSISVEYRLYAAKEPIFTPEDYDRKLAFVLSGECTVKRIKSDGGKVPLNTLLRGDSFGIMAVMCDIDDFPTEVSAKTRCEILMLKKEDVREIVRKNSEVAFNLISFLANRINFLNKKIATFSSDSVEEKLANFLLSEAERQGCDEFLFNAKKTADAISSGRASLYRAVTSLSERGIITLKDKKIIIHDRIGLERITK